MCGVSAPDYADLREVLGEIAGVRGEIDSRKLAHYLRRFEGVIVGGLKLGKEDGRERARWAVLGV